MNISNLREKMKTEKAKLKDMTRKEKFSYFVTYYGAVTLAVAAALVFLTVLLVDVAHNKARVPNVSIGIQLDFEDLAGADLEQAMQAAFPETNKNTAPRAVYFLDPNSSSNGMSAIQLVTYIGSGELDALICTKDTLEFIDSPGVLYYPEGSDFPGYDLSETEIGKRLLDAGCDSVYLVLLDEAHVDKAMEFADYLLSQQ